MEVLVRILIDQVLSLFLVRLLVFGRRMRGVFRFGRALRVALVLIRYDRLEHQVLVRHPDLLVVGLFLIISAFLLVHFLPGIVCAPLLLVIFLHVPQS